MKTNLAIGVFVFALGVLGLGGQAQTIAAAQVNTPLPTATPFPLPPSNAFLIYDRTTVTLVNPTDAPLSLTGVSFMRAGLAVKLALATYGISSLAPHHCVAWWLSGIGTPAPPAECTTRDRFGVLTKGSTNFWIGDTPNEPFRPELNGSALTICNTSAGRCQFHIPQAAETQQPWIVLDPQSGLPLPAGIQVAYDANQLWIGNFMPNTLLTTATLRVIYTVNGKGIVWTPSHVQWDNLGQWDNRGLGAGQCILMYKDPAKITPILPCTPVAQTLNADQPWTLAFDVMGPREERRSPCGNGKPTPGPVLCIIGG